MADLTQPAAAPPDRDSPDRLSLRLSPEARQTLEQIARLRSGVSFAEVVRRALGTELFFLKAEKEGGRVLIEEADKTIRQVVFR